MTVQCIHPPTSLQDAEAILVCAGGSGWGNYALLGLGTVVVVAVVLVLLWGAVKAAAR